MVRVPVRPLLVGRDERTAWRFLVLATVVAASTLAVLTFGRPSWQGVPDVVGVALLVAYLVGTALAATAHAFRNDGLLATLLGTVVLLVGVGVYVGFAFVACALERGGCPTLVDKALLGIGLATLAAVPIGTAAFVVGAGGRRLRARSAESE